MLSLTEINQRRKALAEEVAAIDAVVAEAGEANDVQAARLQEITVEFEELAKQEPTAKKLDEIRNAGVPSGQPANQVRPRIHAQPKEDDGRAGFRDLHECLNTARMSTVNRQMDNRLKALVSNAAGSDEHHTQSDPYGGFLVPPAFQAELLKVDPEGDPTAGLTRNIPMQGPVVTIPARVDKDHSSSVSGGFQVYRRAETQTVSSSRMEVEQVELRAQYMNGVAYASDELLSDSPMAVTALISAGFSEEFASAKLKEKITGTGNGQFEGVLNTPCKVAVAKEGSQAADTIVGANLLKMRKRVWRYRSNAVWLANHDTLEQLAKAHVSGTNGDIYLFRPGSTIPGTEGNPSLDVPDTLLGRPVYFTEYCKTLGDEGDIMCVNWSEYLMGTMIGGPQQRSSIHFRFLNHENTFLFFERNDARWWWRTPLTPVNSAETLSPVVTLAARA